MAFHKGHQIIHEGSLSDGIYVVSDGIIKVHIKGYKKRPFILHFGSRGNILGHEIDGNKMHLVSATAVENTNICFIERKDFDMVMSKNDGVRNDLTRELNMQLRKIQLRTVRLAQMTVREKIADALIHICETYNVVDSAHPFRIHLSRQDIGDLIGITKEQVSKSISEFKTAKIIAGSAKYLQVLDYKKLKEIAGDN